MFFTPSEDADANLLQEGIPAQKINRVGNVMIDSLVALLPKATACKINSVPDRYALITLHRPSNVDDPSMLNRIIQALLEVHSSLDVLFPVHPRTRQRLDGFRIDAKRLHLLESLPYVEFLALQRRAAVVITDSGGIQEESTYLNVPCITLRENTERPITVTMGTNTVVGRDTARLKAEISRILKGEGKRGTVPPLWDGQAAGRIARIIAAQA